MPEIEKRLAEAELIYRIACDCALRNLKRLIDDSPKGVDQVVGDRWRVALFEDRQKIELLANATRAPGAGGANFIDGVFRIEQDVVPDDLLKPFRATLR